ncbi:hypothetical protein LshimejAT787_0208520 [Lyophyllum shimeji]|uniref:Uncharacterized protein n=1 Tax=Lyophyllum shimeji TaxID=47721 RepID=A0A9P3PFW7_LYOSH|nr:hypothetical protein LshimejAT787_0208520 [Lyophyllum shimeji]
MSSSFTRVDAVDMSKEKDWPAKLGMLDWDSTSIVFTKRSLIEFLKYTGTTVDTNLANIAKLPRYAKFGKISDDATEPEAQAPVDSTDAVAPASASATNDFKPSRRVRTAPGGSHTDIFADDDDGDALSMAPPKPGAQAASADPAPAPRAAAVADADEHTGIDFGSSYKPSRRVRTTPGGPSSIGSLWDEKPEEFKPTRRVREGPGGQDNINGLF